VSKGYGHEVSVDKNKAVVQQFKSAAFKLAINNTGNIIDSYLISIDLDRSIDVDMAKELVEIEPWSGAKVVLSLTAPAGEPIKKTYPVNLEVMSINGGLERSVNIELVVEPYVVHDLDEFFSDESNLYPEDSGSFLVLLMNKGNVDEEVGFSLLEGADLTVVHPSVLNITKDDVEEVDVRFTVPKDAKAGVMAITIVLNWSGEDIVVNHKVNVLKKATTKAAPVSSLDSTLPILLIVIIIVLVIALVAALSRKPKPEHVPPVSEPEQSVDPDETETTVTDDTDREPDGEAPEDGQGPPDEKKEGTDPPETTHQESDKKV
jgi:hypothetical protein